MFSSSQLFGSPKPEQNPRPYGFPGDDPADPAIGAGRCGRVKWTNEEATMTNYDPNNRRVRDDNSGAWIIGIIVLVAIGIGVWWWAGWGGNNGNNVASAPTAPATTGSAAPRSTTPPATTGSGNTSAPPPASTPAPTNPPANR